MQINDIIRLQHTLQSEIDTAIKAAVRHVVSRTHPNNPQEPDFIAALTINFTQDLFDILSRNFPGNQFSVTGVFCHQKPIVDIGAGKKPELGDLLLVYWHKNNQGQKVLNSILLQAKITDKPVTPVPPTDQHQLKLYESWPDFTYYRAGHLNGKQRAVVPKTVTDGAQYLLMDDSFWLGLAGLPHTFPMGTATPNQKLTLNQDLASELVDFLKLKSGRCFDEDPLVTNDDWTKMIWDLLDITKTAISRRRNYLPHDFNRQHVYMANFTDPYFNGMISSFMNSSMNTPHHTDKGDFIEGENAGISLLIIESNDGEGRNEN